MLYADDTSIYVSSENIDDLFNEANMVLERYKQWFDLNRLNLNASKSQYVLFHRKQKTIPPNNGMLYIGSGVISRVASTKFLGVVIDEHLSWELHVACVARKLAKYAARVFKIRNLVTVSSLSAIYNCLVYPNLTYPNPSYPILAHPSLT